MQRFIDLSSKRSKLAIRFFGYGVSTVATIVLTFLALFYAMGYRLDQSHLGFSQGGLLQFRSTPDGGSIRIDGAMQNFNTPGRADVAAGTHTVQMSLRGYYNWTKTVSLQPGQLLWLNYTRFIPTSISTTSVKQLASLSGALVSPDHKWIAMQEKPDQPSLTFVDISDAKKPSFNTITLPLGQVSKAAAGGYGVFSLVEWDLNSRYLLVRQQVDNAARYIRVDRTKADAAVNISNVFQLGIDEIHFAGSSPNIVFVRTGDVLRRLDVAANVASAALVNGLTSFNVYGSDDVVSYVANNAATNQEDVGLYSHSKTAVVRSFPAGTALHIAYSEYVGDSYLAINSVAGAVQVLRDPVAATKDTSEFTHFDLGVPLAWLQFDPSGRMLMAGAGNNIATYDIEVGKNYAATLDAGGPLTSPPQWLDDFHIWTDVVGKLIIYEFDGQNQHQIATVAPGFIAGLSQDGKVLFTIGKSATGFDLQASNLVKD